MRDPLFHKKWKLVVFSVFSQNSWFSVKLQIFVEIHVLWSKMENDLKMYRFFIRFIRVERRGRKMRFPGRRARWEIFFSRRRKTFLRKKYFSCVFSFFRKNRLAKLLRWCTFLVPKSRYWCLDRKKLILGPKVDFFTKKCASGGQNAFLGPNPLPVAPRRWNLTRTMLF